MATLPISGGTGGSYSVFAAEDGPAAVQALLDEAVATRQHGDVEEPKTLESSEGLEVVTGSFNISAGGWGFNVTSVRGPDDRVATVYVRSSAD